MRTGENRPDQFFRRSGVYVLEDRVHDPVVLTFDRRGYQFFPTVEVTKKCSASHSCGGGQLIHGDIDSVACQQLFGCVED